MSNLIRSPRINNKNSGRLKMPSLHTAFIHDIIKEMKDKPITMLVVIALYVLVPITILYQFSFFASAESVDSLKEEVQQITRTVNTNLQLSISDRLRELATVRCRSVIPHDQKQRINMAIEEWQVKYKEVVGERYAIPECDLLR